jgi:RNA:NAD 2'-phosphotransferase (TPT1/KptA family)
MPKLLSAIVRTFPRTLTLAQARGSYVELDSVHLLHVLHPVLCCRCMIAGALE